MSTRDEEQAIAAIAALLAKFPPTRRAAITNGALQRLAGVAAPGARDAETLPVVPRMPAPEKPRKG